MGGRNIDYKLIFEKAKVFACDYSKNIIVQDIKQTIMLNGAEYPCVQLTIEKKGNQDVITKLLESGSCSKMDGRIVDGKRVCNILLWFDENGINPLQSKFLKDKKGII